MYACVHTLFSGLRDHNQSPDLSFGIIHLSYQFSHVYLAPK